MSAHTPSPWEWWTSNSWNRLRHSERGVSKDVLMPIVLRDGQPTIDARPDDMAAIAAVPEMLAALEPFADVLGEDAEDFPDDTKVTVTFGRTIHYALTLGDLRRAVAALAKAEGRKP